MTPWHVGVSTAVAAVAAVGGVSAAPVGDITGDGGVDDADTEALVEHLLGSVPLLGPALARADTNGDGAVDTGDTVLVVNFVHPPVPEMIAVPGGSFQMGNPWVTQQSDQLPVHQVSLSAYEIGRFEVTNAEFVAYLNSALSMEEISVASGEVRRNNADHTLITETTGASVFSQIEFTGTLFTPRVRDGHSTASHPVTRVTWFGAATYCNWLSRRQGLSEAYTEALAWAVNLTGNGYRLPTEAEWERAAAWDPNHTGSMNYPVPIGEAAFGHWRYPFMSDTLPLFTRANYYDTASGRYANPILFLGQPFTSPVGFYDGVNVGRSGQTANSPSPAGCYDMGGNAYEWCTDWYSNGYYAVSPAVNPPGPDTGTMRVLRGGSWYDSDSRLTTSSRLWSEPGNLLSVGHRLGFRVARRS